jgi:surface antigen
MSFGWFRTLDDEQEDMYQQSIIHALEYAEIGEPVKWYLNDASGSAETVYEYPSTSGVCRRLHIQAIAYGVQKVKGVTACYNYTSTKWTWHAAK